MLKQGMSGKGPTMRTTVKYTKRTDGNGVEVLGFYVIVNGVPIGKPWKTYEAAYSSMEQYIREVRKMQGQV
jgi:radical SAM superfamily enzyme